METSQERNPRMLHYQLAVVVACVPVLPGPDARSPAWTQILRGHRFLVLTVAFSPDGKTLASTDLDKSICLWDVATGQSRALFREPNWPVTRIAFTMDGKRLLAVVGLEEDTIKVWDVAGRKTIARFACAKDDNPLAVSPDGKTFTSNGPDHEVQLRSLETGKVVQRFRGHTDSVRQAVFGHGGKVLVTSSRDSTIRVWDTATGKLRASIRMDTHPLAISPDGRFLVTAWRDKTVRLWDIAKGEEVAKFSRDEHIASLAYFPDGKGIAVGFRDGVVLLDSKTMKRLKKLPVGPAFAVDVSRDGRWLAAVGPDQGASIRLWPAGDLFRR